MANPTVHREDSAEKIKDEHYDAAGDLEHAPASADDIVKRHGNHTDLSAGFLKEHRGQEAAITEEEERRLVRRIDWRLVRVFAFSGLIGGSSLTSVMRIV